MWISCSDRLLTQDRLGVKYQGYLEMLTDSVFYVCFYLRPRSGAGRRTQSFLVSRWLLSANAGHAGREREAPDQVGVPSAQPIDLPS